MKTNMGTADRIVRIIVAVMIGVLYFAEIISGVTAVVLLILAGIFILTSFMRFSILIYH